MDFVTCNAVDNGEECAGIQEETAPSAQCPSEDCPDCVAAANLALETSPSTESEADGGAEGHNQTEEVTK